MFLKTNIDILSISIKVYTSKFQYLIFNQMVNNMELSKINHEKILIVTSYPIIIFCQYSMIP